MPAPLPTLYTAILRPRTCRFKMMMQEASSAKAADDHQTIMSQCSRSDRKSAMKPPDQILKCPRCDSPNTKFCYYNNYSLTQPRHFCKNCRRYWTKGGALRNVPIGGGCRKNKRPKQQHQTAAGAAADQPRHRHIVDAAASGCLNDDVENGGLSLLQSLSAPMSFPDTLGFAFARIQDSMSAAGDQQPVFGLVNSTPPATNTTSILQSSCQALANLPPLETTLLGLNLPSTKPDSGGFDIPAADLNSLFETGPPAPQISQPPRAASTSFNLSPMESLNNLNADLQWRLQQQQRLAMILAASDMSEANKENSAIRLDIKPAAKPCTVSYYPAAIFNSRPPTCTTSESWNPMSDIGHVEGLYQSGYWNPTAWTSDLQQYISNNSAGALP